MSERVDLGNIRGKQGEKGEKGVGISNIIYNSTSGLEKTYNINLTNGETYTITVLDGANVETIDSIDSASTSPVTSRKIHNELLKKLNSTEKGANNGLATLDQNGKIPSQQLPSFVDDVIEGYYHNNNFYKEDTYETIITGENGKIYVDLDSMKCYRWGGTNYAVVSESLALGNTSTTAYRGDLGEQNSTDITALQNQMTNHNHNSAYYTKNEIDNMIDDIQSFIHS